MTIAHKKTQRDIRIDDLRQPVLSDTAQQAMDHAERHPADLSEGAVLAAAERLTRLTDFGPDDFRPRLRELLADATTPLDRTLTFHLAVGHLAIRLRLRDLLRRHPEIHETRISEPVIIVGPARSGTTYLQGLIAADSRLRSLRVAEACDPVPAAAGTPAAVSAPPWFTPVGPHVLAQPQVLAALLPHLRLMFQQLDPRDMAQESMLMDSNIPSDSDDQTQHYEYMLTVLKALQWQRGPDRWVLKSPMHCEHLGPLMATFPDARVVMTHRDPIALVQSHATMFAYFARLHSTKVDTDAVFAASVDRIESMLRLQVRDRHLIRDDRVTDVLFHEFTADPLAAVERVYPMAGLSLTGAQRARMTAFQGDGHPHRQGRIRYDIRADFGVDPDRLRERFAFYYDSVPVKQEVA